MSQAMNSSVGVPSVVVAIPADIRRRLDLYISQCKYEISGLGTIEPRNGRLEVTEIYLLDQVVSSGDTELTKEAVTAFLVEAAGKEIDLSKVRLWWHSHATLSTFWSPTDEVAINSFDSSPWFVSIVGNHAGDYLARVDFFPQELVPVRLAQKATLQTIYPQGELDSVRGEIEARVSKAPELEFVASNGSSKKARSRSKSRPAGTKTTPQR
jgi:hypothetical protein